MTTQSQHGHKVILFATLDDFSHINQSIENQLVKHFPGYKIDSVQLKPMLKKNLHIVGWGALAVFIEYATDFLSGRKSIRSWRKLLYHTPFMMKYFNRILKKKINGTEYSFAFQTQSVFDASASSVPNFVFTDHTNLNNLNYTLIDPREYLCSSRYIALERKVYENARLLFVMSSNIEDSLIRQYQIPGNKVKLAYVGNNARVHPVVDKEKYKRKNILFVGKDWERKGGPLLVEAFRIVQGTLPDASLTIIGCSPQVSLSNCVVLGELPIEKVPEHYNRASVFCLPTRREPFGIVFVEAMLNRLPIITNTVGATPDLVINNENGFRVEYTPKDYAKALIDLLSDPGKCESFGERSFEIARSKYTWENVGELISMHIKQSLEIQ